MKGTIKEIKKKAGAKTVTLAIFASILTIIFIFWGYVELTRPLDLRDLDPQDYADNTKLMQFAEDLKIADDISDVFYILNVNNSKSVYKDPRFVDVLILCLHEKQSAFNKFYIFIKYIFENYSFIEFFTDFGELLDIFKEYMSGDSRIGYREFALSALENLEEDAIKAVPVVTELLLNDSSQSIREQALLTLAAIKAPESYPVILRFINNDNSKLTAKSEPGYIYPVSRCFADYIDNEKKIYDMIQLLESPKDCTRLFAIYVYMNLDEKLNRSENYEKKIIELVKKDSSETVRDVAIRALSYTPCKTAAPVILDILYNDPSPVLRSTCIDYLNDFTSKKDAYPHIIKVLKTDSDISVRESCLMNIWHRAPESKEAETIDVLLSILKDPKEDIQLRSLAADSICNFDKKHLQEKGISGVLISLVSNKKIPQILKDVCINCLAGMGYEKADDILNIIESKYKNHTISNKDVESIGALGDPRGVDLLVKILKDSEFMDWKYSIIMAIGQIKSEKSVDTLMKLLKDAEYDKYKILILKALCKVNSRKAVNPLLELLEKEKGKKFMNLSFLF